VSLAVLETRVCAPSIITLLPHEPVVAPFTDIAPTNLDPHPPHSPGRLATTASPISN